MKFLFFIAPQFSLTEPVIPQFGATSLQDRANYSRGLCANVLIISFSIIHL